MKSNAVSHGAVTIVNAIAIGKGSAVGIDLETKASVGLNNSGRITVRVKNAPGEDTNLVELCAEHAFNHFGVDYGAVIETESNIPIARGLKSSSAAANAVVLATVDAILRENPGFEKPSDIDMVNLGVDAAINAKVTITGAFDDASASYFGGFVVTDNEKRKILKAGEMKPLKVLLFVPGERTYTAGVDVDRTKILGNEVLIAWNEALRGNLYSALNLNGILYSATLNQNPEIALSALKAGAIAAGLCGTGPAVAALTAEDPRGIREAWQRFGGDIIEARVNNEKARVLR
jgi:shikimate kinase